MNRFSIPLKITSSFWMAAFLIGWMASSDMTGAFLWVTVVLVSVVVHEMGHALTAALFGQTVRIELGFLGGVTYRYGRAVSKLQDFVIVLMGPVSSLLLAAICWWGAQAFHHMRDLLPSLLYTFFFANIFWTFLNIVPVLPLDGGKLMQIALVALFKTSGERLSYLFSCIASAVFVVVALYMGGVFVACLLLLFAFDSYRMWQKTSVYIASDVEQQIIQEMNGAKQEWLLQHPDAAIARLEALCSHYPEERAIEQATVQLANYLLTTQKANKAFFYLVRVEKTLSLEGLKLLQLAAYETMDWKKALEAGQRIFLEEGGDVSSALLNAFSAARLAQAPLAINWLLAAAKEGEVDMKKVMESEDFDLIRSHPRFVQLMTG